jgi:hypothetical protein
MAGIFALAGFFALLTGLALYETIEAARWRNLKRLVLSLTLSVPLACASAGAFWLGAQNPRLHLVGHAGFGAEWECTPVAKGEPVCVRTKTPAK